MSEAQVQTSEAEVEDQEDDADAPLSNDQRVNDFNKDVRALGRDAGKGVDALPKLGLRLVRAGRDGLAKDEKKFVHDAYDTYVKQLNKKRIHVQTKESRAAQVSKLNQFKLLGEATKFNGEEVADRIVEVFKAANEAGTKTMSCYAAYVAAARAANAIEADKNRTDAPSDDDLRNAMLPAEKKEKTLTDVVQSICDALQDLQTGERRDGIACQDQEIIDATDQLRNWLAKMTLASEFAALQTKLAAMGKTIAIQ